MEGYTMTFRTNRLYCLLTKSFWAELIPSLLFLALGMFLVWSRVEKLQTAMLVFPAAMVLIGLSHISRQPKEFTVRDNELTLSMNLKKKLPPYVRVNKKNWTWAKLFVVLRDVKRIEFRSFSGDRIGNIRLYGSLYAQDFDGDCADIRDCPEFVELCGVQDFTEVQYQLKKAFPGAEIVRI
jgi:hypothetical protein